MKKIPLLLFLFSFEICSAQQWFPLQGGLSGNDAQNNKVASMCNDTINHILYVGGYIDACNADTGNIIASNIARWDGTNWSQLIIHLGTFSGNGFGQVITSMVLHGSEIYLSVSNTAADIYGVLRFDVNTFEFNNVGTFNNSLNSLCFYNDTLYVGGAFTKCDTGYFVDASSPSISRVAKYDGTQWQQVGTGISGGAVPEVHALCVHHNKLYAAGIFENAGGTYCKNIACWNDTSWSSVGNGIGFSGQFDCILYSLASYKNKLYAGGDFSHSASGIESGLVVWNDTTWASTGNNPIAVYTLKTIDDKLYLGANWAGVLAFPYLWNFISVYNDTTWKLIPKGPTYEVHAIEKFDSMIYAGGRWIQINDSTPCGYVARYDPTIIQDTTAIVEVKQNASAINIYPNPATNEIKISSLSPEEN